MKMTDSVVQYILSLLEAEHGSAEFRRNELAETIGCVPSQISYVISSRFTPEQGYLVESRRGGGGLCAHYPGHAGYAIPADASGEFHWELPGCGHSGGIMLRNLVERKALSPAGGEAHGGGSVRPGPGCGPPGKP